MPPGVGYFAGAPNAFAGGMEYSAATRRRRLQENALTALINRFGPEAAMPEEQSILQATQQRTQLQPHVVGAAERATTGAEANVSEYGAQAGDPEANEIQTREQEMRRSVLHRAVTALRMVRDREGDVRSALPQFGQILTRIGMPPDELQQLEQQIITNPDSLDELDAMLGPDVSKTQRGLSGGVPMRNNETGELEWVIPTEGGYRTIPGYTPASAEQADRRLGQGATRLGLQSRELTRKEMEDIGFKAPPGYHLWWEGEPGNSRIVADAIPGSAQEREREAGYAEQLNATSENINTLFTTVIEPAKTVVREFETALGIMGRSPLFDRASWPLGATRQLMARLYDSDVREIERLIESAKSNIGFNQLSAMPRGLGHVTERQLEVLQSVLGKFTIDRQPELLKRDIEQASELYGNIQRNAEIELQRQEVERERLTRAREGRYGPPIPPPPGGSGVTRPPPGPDATPEEILRYYAPQGGG